MEIEIVENQVEKIHPFQKAGLGLYPYRYLGVEKRVHSVAGGSDQPGGCCCYCSTGILYCFHFVSADGKKFYVGSDCVLKAGGDKLVKIISKDVNAHKKEQRKIAEAKRAEAAKGKVLDILANEEVKVSLAKEPHPNYYFAEQGKSLLDYVEFFVNNKKWVHVLKVIKDIKIIVANPIDK